MKARQSFRINGILLSRVMAAMMLRHVEGSHALRSEEREILDALCARGLIHVDDSQPNRSMPTGKGREVIAGLLASQADNLFILELE